MSVFQAKAGESRVCTVVQKVLLTYWTKSRARPGTELKLGAVVKDVKDGAKVELKVLGPGEKVLDTLSGTLSGGKVEVDWKVNLDKLDVLREEVPLVFTVLVGDKIKSKPADRPVLTVDVGTPDFSL